jgi:hypothetical protein
MVRLLDGGGFPMLASQINLPNEIPGLTREAAHALHDHVAAADETLRDITAGLEFHTVHAEWKLAPGTSPPRIELSLTLGTAHATHQFSVAELADPDKLRQRLRDVIWDLVSACFWINQREINKLLNELEYDHMAVGK